jgi:ESCRT-II complex subunit VPS22
MRRRAGGLGEIQKQKEREAKFREKREELAENELGKLSEQMEAFRGHLQQFAAKHKKDIRKKPELRRQFQEMCAAVGVDPLQSSSNFWTKLLGVGDFYYELATQIVEVCMSTSHRNGGIMPIEELLTRVRASRGVARDGKTEEIAVDDLLRAIDKLARLGGGLKAVPCGKSHIIQAVATEMSMDANTILLQAQANHGHVDEDLLTSKLSWSHERSSKAVNDLVMEGIVWVDSQATDGKTWYWFPGLT